MKFVSFICALNHKTYLMTEFWTGLGDFFISSFKILPAIGNSINYAYIVIGSLLFVYWMIELYKFKKKDILE